MSYVVFKTVLINLKAVYEKSIFFLLCDIL